MSGKVRKGSKVELLYKGKVKSDGRVFDSTEKDPIKIEVGAPEVIQGLSEAILGMNPGDSKTVEVEPNQAYGTYDHELVVEVLRSKLPDKIKLGDALSDSGNANQVWWVKDIQGDKVLLDANHPLAGETLIFEVELLKVA